MHVVRKLVIVLRRFVIILRNLVNFGAAQVCN